MKKITLLAIMLSLAIMSMAQVTMMSPRMALALQQQRNGKGPAGDIRIFATLVDGADQNALKSYGVKVNSTVENTMTLQIPADRLADFVASGLCSYIDLPHKVYPLLDKA